MVNQYKIKWFVLVLAHLQHPELKIKIKLMNKKVNDNRSALLNTINKNLHRKKD